MKNTLYCAFSSLLLFAIQSSTAQTIMFDDFNYESVNDAQLTSFNKWNVINGVSGPPEGGLYQRNNIQFKADPTNPSNKLMTLATTVNGQTKAITHSRIETQGYEYFEGTYAARVYFSETPFGYKDANIQTFYTIVGSNLSGDGSKYSELDFEYMAADKWGISENNQVMYLTSWNRYIADPWQAWKRYWSEKKSYAGWHTFVVSCTDGKNVNYYMDGQFITSMATTDNDGTSVYPRSMMQVAFANWVWNSVIGASTDSRSTTMEVDWVLFQKNTALTPAQVNTQVSTFRTQGVQRQNLAGQKHIVLTVPQGPYNNVAATIPGTIQAENYDLGGQGIAFNDTDAINEGGAYRTDGVDIEPNGTSGYNVGYIAKGEWVEYTVNVTQTNAFNIDAKVANGGTVNGKFHLEINNATIGQSATVTNTGGWSVWKTLSLGQANLTKGEYIIKMVADEGGFNLDEITFSIATVTGYEESVKQTLSFYPNPVRETLTLQSEAQLDNATITIWNNNGMEVSTPLVKNNQLNVSHLPKGQYLIDILLEEKHIKQSFIKID